MTQTRIGEYIEDFLSDYDEGRFPAEFLADYEAIECLGSNERNETLLVRNRKSGTVAVTKCYRREDGCRYEDELLKRLDHPALPRFIAQYSNADTVCVVRDYIEGNPLDRLLCEYELTRAQKLLIAVQLCDILTYLHSLTPPVIHRDIKPENIIIRKNGAVALIDFGISRAYDKNARTDTRHLGTVSFAPPEQYGFSQTDCRSDIFSLGMVLGYMFTGSTDIETIQAYPDDAGIRRVLKKSTAFAPRDRYKSAAQFQRALTAQLPGERLKRRVLLIAASALALAGVVLLCIRLGGRQTAVEAPAAPVAAALNEAPAIEDVQSPLGVEFAEPLIEEAVRAQLGKAADDPISEDELLSVEALYVFANAVSATQDEFYASANDYYAADNGTRGSVRSLEDVAKMPNLKAVCLAAQQISDISPLAALNRLEKVELKHNSISDVSALSGLTALVSVGLNDNLVSDLTPLESCPGLRFLDLCDASAYDPSFLDAMGDFEFLDIANSTQSYAHLGERYIKQLKIGYSRFDSLSWLDGVRGLESLEVKHSALTSLEGIEAHDGITYFNIAGCAIADLSPALSLPALDTLVISEDMRDAADIFTQDTGVNVTIE